MPLGRMDTRVWLSRRKVEKGASVFTVGTTLFSVPFPTVIPTDGFCTLTLVHAHTHRDHMHTQHSVCNSVFLPKISFKQEHFYPLLFCE